ncbi:hypothetical protein ACQKKK_08060 [Peribacillus sp. NPDC006672]
MSSRVFESIIMLLVAGIFTFFSGLAVSYFTRLVDFYLAKEPINS